ncbi:MAG: thioesterase family protein [Desulfotomaculaceae bacterium]|nr:thioesterase family protein [Desulfotomaculaceae bacterium]
MDSQLSVGILGEATLTVDESNTAIAHGSGTVSVLATPALIALMEKAAQNSVAPFLVTGSTTVGTMVNIKHLAATPIGLNVAAASRLTEVDGRRLVFEVEVKDDVEIVATGVHERFIIKVDSFMKRAANKSKS